MLSLEKRDFGGQIYSIHVERHSAAGKSMCWRCLLVSRLWKVLAKVFPWRRSRPHRRRLQQPELPRQDGLVGITPRMAFN